MVHTLRFHNIKSLQIQYLKQIIRTIRSLNKKPKTKEGLRKLRQDIMNQFEYEDYFDDIYLSSIKRKPPILKSILLNFYGGFVCLWQKIVKEHIITEMEC